DEALFGEVDERLADGGARDPQRVGEGADRGERSGRKASIQDRVAQLLARLGAKAAVVADRRETARDRGEILDGDLGHRAALPAPVSAYTRSISSTTARPSRPSTGGSSPRASARANSCTLAYTDSLQLPGSTWTSCQPQQSKRRSAGPVRKPSKSASQPD